MQTDTKRYIGLALALLAIGAAILWIEAPWETGSSVPPPPSDIPAWALENPGAADFAGAQGWVNSEPVDLVELREDDRVVLVDFWTYSCRNCINTFPYLRAWHEAYADEGLVIVGVHTPEFRFERDIENVQAATERYNLTYPVAIDNDYEIWNAYHNRFWPAKYLIDQWGRIRYHHFGEGGYAETEQMIRDLISETGRDPGPPANISVEQGGLGRGQTPELFASHLDGRKRHAIGNDEGYHPGQTITYSEPEEIRIDRIYLTGTWRNEGERVVAQSTDATVTVNFRAGGTNLVAGALNGTCARVWLDGEPIPEQVWGPDIEPVDGTPCIRLDAERAYDLYSGPFERHAIQLDVPAGFQLYSFAFSYEGR